ncbi:MAG: ATP-binding protein [Candidatus Falkowbacteria bacterium]
MKFSNLSVQQKITIAGLTISVAAASIFAAVCVYYLFFNKNNDYESLFLIMVFLAIIFCILFVVMLFLVLFRDSARASKRLSDDKLKLIINDSNFNVSVDSGDETNYLAKTFNFVADNIREREQKIVEYTCNLERMIDEKNIDLSVTNKLIVVNEKKIKDILHNSPFPLFFVNKEHKVVYWSRAMARITNTKEVDLLGENNYWKALYFEKRLLLIDLILDNRTDEIHNLYRDVKKSKLIKDGYEVIDFFPNINGGTWFHFAAAAVRDNYGKVIGALEVFEDITEYKKTEEIASVERIKYEEMVNNVPVGMYRSTLGLKGRFTEVNPFMVTLTEANSKEELLRYNITKLYNDPVKRREIIDSHLFEGYVKDVEVQIKTLKGNIKWVSITSAMKKDRGGEVYFDGIVMDITERKKAEASQVEIYKKLKEVDEVKTEFVSLASHQLRTPLSSIGWYAEMLLSGEVGKLNRKQRQYVSVLQQSSRRMVALINSLLNVSRLEMGIFIVEPEPINLIESAQEIIVELGHQIKAKKQVVNKLPLKNKLPLIQADPKLIRVIWQNLLSNAVKYTPAQGKINVKVRVVAAGEMVGGKKIDKEAFLGVVADSGIGIPKAQQYLIFSKLFRADNVRLGAVEGTGLGLYIVKKVLDKCEGDIWFKSVEGVGTTFYFTLPKTGMKRKQGTKSLT